MGYTDSTWAKMRQSGLRMIFTGAESGSDAKLAEMNKGGKASTSVTLDLARRARTHGIVPEFSFVLGSPPEPLADVRSTFEFIRTVKEVNSASEIVMYLYTPVPLDGQLYDEAQRHGFQFPDSLDEWASDHWRDLSLRRGQVPWLAGQVRRQVRDFERVLNAFYPTVTDIRLTRFRRAVLRTVSGWRYQLRFYRAPLELDVLQRLFRYQRPETTGF